ncbi:hypothetical protein BTE28158_04632 [Burkholderia territorii]|nr:hypothetical protein BTE28158_04632 [Burkholderia territorii]
MANAHRLKELKSENDRLKRRIAEEMLNRRPEGVQPKNDRLDGPARSAGSPESAGAVATQGVSRPATEPPKMLCMIDEYPRVPGDRGWSQPTIAGRDLDAIATHAAVRQACVCSVGQRRRIYRCQGHALAARRCNRSGLHCAWQSMAKRIRRKLQRQTARRIAKTRIVPQPRRGQGAHRTRPFYNERRPHSAHGYQPPAAVRRACLDSDDIDARLTAWATKSRRRRGARCARLHRRSRRTASSLGVVAKATRDYDFSCFPFGLGGADCPPIASRD